VIVTLADAARRPPSKLGNKAATLATLAANGFLVPDGFVVPVDVEPSSDDLHQAAQRLRDSKFAVRSSAVAEDQADASYAGLYETFLNVRLCTS
jgi:rifampicin phosphotransferase